MSFEQVLSEDLRLIEAALDGYTAPQGAAAQSRVVEAMRYSLLKGGKRLRALLALEFCRALGGDMSLALPAACALEMVHAYSLIHDDLPCMDDDDTRRGRPSCHIAFGEGMAVLAGDGLLTLAFEILSVPETIEHLGARPALAMVGVLSAAAGVRGMVGGQAVDLLSEGKTLTLPAHDRMVAMKTGALIGASVHCGCIAAGADAGQIALALGYADRVGRAFQITDDLLDVTGSSEQMGKRTGSDLRSQKATYVSLMGLSAARRQAEDLFLQARGLLSRLCPDNDFLPALTDALALRRS
jgi:geranylgeranyl diphosphate synthase type II